MTGFLILAILYALIYTFYGSAEQPICGIRERMRARRQARISSPEPAANNFDNPNRLHWNWPHWAGDR